MRKTTPIYKTIADDLIAAIASGTYPLGAKLPTEHELMARLGVSRATVIAAFAELEAHGMVKRRPRSGTQVISRFPMRSEIEGIVFNDWANYGVEYIFMVDAATRSTLPACAGPVKTKQDGWLHLSGRRVAAASKKPICTVDLYVHPDYADVEGDVSPMPPRIYTLIEARHGPLVRTVDQELRVVDVDAARARILSVAEGSSAAQILRWYLGPKDKLIEFTIDVHPGDRFHYRTRTHRQVV